MSAIFGKLHFDGKPVPSSELLVMQQAMAYWGPDGDGTWCNGSVGLGHLRLDSTPESIGDAMPWVCPDSGDVITATARLDNRDELLNTLSIPLPGRVEIPDSRIILEAYHRWGERCVDRLLGDWAFAIWNASERELFVARDHHGNTGLYYYADSRCLAFASSLKGLLALPEIPQRPDPQTIAKILVAWTGAQGATTCYEGILRLPPAHMMTVSPKAVDVKRYWYLEDTPELRLGTDDDYIDAFLEIYAEAVRCRLRCSTPVGVTLSGGLDSGSVAALAAGELGKGGQRLAAFSSVPVTSTEGFASWHLGNETPLIEATAGFVGNIDVNYIDAKNVSPFAGLERALSIHDQPVHGVKNMYWLSALMAEVQSQGLRALLTGQGGNSTISWTGGPRARLLKYLVRLQWVTFGKRLRAQQQATGRSLRQAVRSEIIQPLLEPVRQRQLRSRHTSEGWRDYSAINVAFGRELDLTHQMVQRSWDSTFALKKDPRKARLTLIRPGGGTTGQVWYEIGGAYGVEARDPTFDRRVMSFCLSIPRSQYLRGDQDRLLIRRAMSGHLPDRVLQNRRLGVQAADIAQRIVDHRGEMDAALARLERSDLPRHYLDLPKMRGVFESIQRSIDRDNSAQCSSILLRGLMVGVFLLRFD